MENENLSPVEKLTPFTKMIMTIGTLPSSFYASMSYYESMVWLYEYLKNQVIPTVNNNAEAVEELQTAFLELKEWTETYTEETIPVEIQNALDEMAEDGTLTSKIVQLGTVQKIYDTLQDLLNDETVSENMKVKVLGFNSINDGGQATYYITDTEEETYQIELQNNLYGTLLDNFGNTKVYGNDLNALKSAIENSDSIVMFDDLVIDPNSLTISSGTNKVIDMNNHKITMKASSENYANIIRITTTGNIKIMNGKIDGNYSSQTPSAIINHTGILCENGNTTIENMEIYNCYYEGIILNGLNAKATVENCYLHDNGRNDIACLSWLYFKCNNSKFDGAIDSIDPLANIILEPYTAESKLGIADITNCVFASTTKNHSFGSYLDANQTDSAIVSLKNNIFYNRVRLGYDRGLVSHYILENNKHLNITNKSAILITETVANIDINDSIINCDTGILFDLAYTFGTIRNVNINATILPATGNAVTIQVPAGTLTYEYPINNINIKTNSNNIVNWKYLHNSVITTPPLISDSNITLDMNHFYSNIYMVGYGNKCSIDGIYNKSKQINPSFTIHSDVNNIVESAYLPAVDSGIGTSGITVPGNSSSFAITLHNHNYNKFIIDSIVGIHNARNT